MPPHGGDGTHPVRSRWRIHQRRQARQHLPLPWYHRHADGTYRKCCLTAQFHWRLAANRRAHRRPNTVYHNYLVDDKLAHGEGRFSPGDGRDGQRHQRVRHVRGNASRTGPSSRRGSPVAGTHLEVAPGWCPSKNSWGRPVAGTPTRVARPRRIHEGWERVPGHGEPLTNEVPGTRLGIAPLRQGDRRTAPVPAAPSSGYFGPAYTTSSRMRSGDSNIAE